MEFFSGVDKTRKIQKQHESKDGHLPSDSKTEALVLCLRMLEAEATMENLDKVIELGKKHYLKDLLMKAYIKKGDIFYKSYEFTDAFTSLYEALELCKETGDLKQQGIIYNKLGKCKHECLCYSEALTYFGKSYHYSFLAGDMATMKNSYYNLSLTHKKRKDFDAAIDIINEYIKNCDINEDIDDYIDGCILKANCYLDMKLYQEAIRINNHILDILPESRGSTLGYIYNNLGLIYLGIGDINNSLHCFEKSQAIRSKQDFYNLSHTLIDKAKLFVIENQLDHALELLEEGIKIADANNDPEYKLKAYYQLEAIYKDKRDSDLLEKLYLKIIELLKKDSNHKNILQIYLKLSLLALERGDIDSGKKYTQEAIKYHDCG